MFAEERSGRHSRDDRFAALAPWRVTYMAETENGHARIGWHWAEKENCHGRIGWRRAIERAQRSGSSDDAAAAEDVEDQALHWRLGVDSDVADAAGIAERPDGRAPSIQAPA